MIGNKNSEFPDQQKYIIDVKIFDALEDAIKRENIEDLSNIARDLTLFDIIDFLISTKSENRSFFLLALQDELDPMLFVEIEEEFLNNMIEIFDSESLVRIIIKLELKDLLYLINRIDNDIKEHIIPLFPRFLQLEIYQNLSYPEESAGRWANKNFIIVLNNWKVGHVLDFLENKKKKITDKFHQIFVVDYEMRPLGFCELCDLLFIDHDIIISDIMNTEIKTVDTEVEQEEVAHILRKYALSSIPVINKKGSIVGTISLEYATEILEEEADEDTLLLGGVSENDIHFNVWQTTRKRFPWLVINMILASITSTVISLFDTTIEKTVILAALSPLIASTGGNSGLQTVTVIIKSLANRDITKQNVKRIFIKEIFSGLLNGFLLASSASMVIFFIFHKISLSFIFGISIISVFFISNFLATCIPLILNYCKIDPAISSSIIITTMTDISSAIIFLGMAALMF